MNNFHQHFQSSSSSIIHAPRDEQFGQVGGESVAHFATADVGDALQRQVDVDGIARLQVVFDRLDDQADQIRIAADQHGDEEVALGRIYRFPIID